MCLGPSGRRDMAMQGSASQIAEGDSVVISGDRHIIRHPVMSSEAEGATTAMSSLPHAILPHVQSTPLVSPVPS